MAHPIIVAAARSVCCGAVNFRSFASIQSSELTNVTAKIAMTSHLMRRQASLLPH